MLETIYWSNLSVCSRQLMTCLLNNNIGNWSGTKGLFHSRYLMLDNVEHETMGKGTSSKGSFYEDVMSEQ